MKGLCSPRILTPFNTLSLFYIFIIIVDLFKAVACCRLLFVLLLLLLLSFEILSFLLFQRGRYVTESASERKKIFLISVVELNYRPFFLACLVFSIRRLAA